MVGCFKHGLAFILISLVFTAHASAQSAGSIRGVVTDAIFEGMALPDITVTVAETGQTATTDLEGRYSFPELAPGSYTLLFSGTGFAATNRADIVVIAGQITDVDIEMSAELVDLDEFIVQDLRLGAGTELELLELRIESPALIDAVSSEVLSLAGIGDAAGALSLVAGTTVADNKAVVRGLPDRYVSNQMNGVRLPSADAETRAVELDQFPSDVIRSVQVSKTFTPDQQGDASGGAVNVVLNGIPQENIFKVSFSYSANTNASFRDDFQTYVGGGVDAFGFNDGSRADPTGVASTLPIDSVPFGTTTGPSPIDYSLGITLGGREDIGDGWTVGGLATFFYSRDSFFFDEGIDDKWWIDDDTFGVPAFEPQFSGDPGSRITSLFDTVRASEEVKWGGLATAGIENESNAVNLIYMYTRSVEDETIVSNDTRGKIFFPSGGANDSLNRRATTLKYVERTTDTIQLNGRHTLPVPNLKIGDYFQTLPPEIDWTISRSEAVFNEPDKRLAGAQFKPESTTVIPFPPFIIVDPSTWSPQKPGSFLTFGTNQRLWKNITESSDQYSVNLKLPFEQWAGAEGYIKVGAFNDQVSRFYDQNQFSNFGQTNAGATVTGEDFDFDFISVFPTLPGALDISDGVAEGAQFDIDYAGQQDITALYIMTDLPIDKTLKVIGGVRHEEMKMATTVIEEVDATFINFDLGGIEQGIDSMTDRSALNADFAQTDLLPAVSLVYTPNDTIIVRGSYTETIARQTFREIVPIIQQEFLGADIFVGNPRLKMASLRNYDLRFDYKPRPSTLVSVSYFLKEIEDPIEYVQQRPANAANYTFITPVNFPDGELSGWEFEIREDIGNHYAALEGLAISANATIIDAEVNLDADQIALFSGLALAPNITSREMLNAPEYLYNINLTYNSESTGTRVGLFYTVKGDTLVAGPGEGSGRFIPGVFQTEVGTLNVTVSQQVHDNIKLSFKAKNLLDPDIQEVYRTPNVPGDQLKTSYRKGIDFSLGLSAEFTF